VQQPDSVVAHWRAADQAAAMRWPAALTAVFALSCT
jgi:hypothetical protein